MSQIQCNYKIKLDAFGLKEGDNGKNRFRCNSQN